MRNDEIDFHNVLLDFIINITGASQILNKLYKSLKANIKEVDEIKFPLLENLIRNDRKWISVINSYSGYFA